MNLYFTDKSLNKNIIATQLCEPLRLLNEKNQGVGNSILIHQSKEIMINGYKVDFIVYRHNFEKYSNIIFKQLDVKNVYTRSVLEFFTIFIIKIVLFKNYKIHFDFRGLASDEFSLKKSKGIKYNILYFFEWLAYSQANSLRTVSEKFREYLLNRFGKEKEIIVTPCCTKSASIRSRVFKETLSFVYIGSIAKWQKFEEALQLFNEIEGYISSSLTIVTPDLEKAKELCLRMGIKANVLSVKPDQVVEVLKDCDFGFLLRDDIPLNNVASPVKFLEYISAGVVPIMSKGIGDYSELVLQEDIGIIARGDITTVVRDIKRLSSDPELFKRMYQVSSKYTWDNYYLNFRLS